MVQARLQTRWLGACLALPFSCCAVMVNLCINLPGLGTPRRLVRHDFWVSVPVCPEEINI